jgi:Condensation domain
MQLVETDMNRRNEMSAIPNQRDAVTVGRYVRELGARERLLHLCALEHPTHFCVVAEIVGDIAPEAYIPAFATLQRRHPMLNVDIQAPAGSSGGAFHAINRPIEVKIRAASQAHDWQREVERELNTPQPGSPGPLMRATILHQHDRVHVVLTFHHAIADGLSGAFIIRDLMAALNGCVILPLPRSPSMEELFSALPRSAGDDAAPVPQLDPAELRALAGQDIWRKFDEDRIVVSTLALGERLTARIGEGAKANGTTVHGAISAALALSLFDQGAAASVTILSPVSLRSMLGLDEECGFFSLAGVACLPHDRSEFWTLARQATDELARSRSRAGVSASVNFMTAHVTAQTTADVASGILGRIEADAVLSNLGKLAIPQTIGRLRLNAFWGPMTQVRLKRERFIGVATLGHRLRLVQTSPHGTPSLLQAIKDYLKSAVGADRSAGSDINR